MRELFDVLRHRVALQYARPEVEAPLQAKGKELPRVLTLHDAMVVKPDYVNVEVVEPLE